MSVQTVQQTVTIEWDDSVVIVFSFNGTAGKVFCGFPHTVVATQSQTGSQTQVSAILQTLQQVGIQVSLDPATWVETIKNGSRASGNKITIVYEDSTSVNYTTQTGTIFQLQQLFSLAG